MPAVSRRHALPWRGPVTPTAHRRLIASAADYSIRGQQASGECAHPGDRSPADHVTPRGRHAAPRCGSLRQPARAGRRAPALGRGRRAARDHARRGRLTGAFHGRTPSPAAQRHRRADPVPLRRRQRRERPRRRSRRRSRRRRRTRCRCSPPESGIASAATAAAGARPCPATMVGPGHTTGSCTGGEPEPLAGTPIRRSRPRVQIPPTPTGVQQALLRATTQPRRGLRYVWISPP